MGGDKITSIDGFRKVEKTVVEICLEAVEDMEPGPRIALTNVLSEPTEDLNEVLKGAIETSQRLGVGLKDTLFPGVMGYYKGLASGKDKALGDIKETHNRQLTWLQLSLKNRFSLAEDDVLLKEIDQMKISNPE